MDTQKEAVALSGVLNNFYFKGIYEGNTETLAAQQPALHLNTNKMSNMKQRITPVAMIRLVAAMLFAIAIGSHASAQPDTSFLPLPATARPQVVPKEGYILQKVGKSGYVVMVGFSQASFVVTAAGVVVIDAPPSMAIQLPAAIKSVTDKPVTHVIYTHDHYDHIGAATIFKGAKFVAHARTAELLKLYPDPKRPVPTITFDGEYYTLKVGGVDIKLIYPGPNHEAGNIIVFVPEDKLAVLMDIFMPGWAPFRGWGNADHIPGVLYAFDALLKLDFDTFVGGHIYRTGTKAEVEEARAFVADMWKETQSAIAAHPFQPSAYDGNVWAAQKAWFDQVAGQATANLVAKWKNKIGAVDVFTYDTVAAIVVSIITDGMVLPDNMLR
jgi:glyoxylase-like metal-dependent hydrolase (beta-lactamase superfamily II)